MLAPLGIGVTDYMNRVRFPPGLVLASLSLWLCSYAVQTWFMALGPGSLELVHAKRAFLTFIGASAYFTLCLNLQASDFAPWPRRVTILVVTTVCTALVLWSLRIAIDAYYAGDPLNPIEDAQWVLVWLCVFLMWAIVGTPVYRPGAMPAARVETFTRKALSRLVPDQRDAQMSQSIRWCRERGESIAAWASRRDPLLWDEALSFSARLKSEAEGRLQLPRYIGGGSATSLLYFLTRRLRPVAVLETGVAAGWSSAAFLAAMERNGQGVLYSSDLPYFGHPGADGVIGIVVPSHLKRRWRLYIDGDRSNLPRILAKAPNIQIAHYDSEKTYAGRDYFTGCFTPRQIRRTLWIFDDIEDNMHFRDWTAENSLKSHVFYYDGKYLGLAAAPALYLELFG